MRIVVHVILLFILLLNGRLLSQEFIIKKNRPKYRTSFKRVGNLIVVKLAINGSSKMNFILDSGASYTIITNLSTIDKLNLKQGEEVSLKGLGKGFESKAYLSKNNRLQLGRISTNQADVILLYNSDLKLSNRLGLPIHGVIGYDFFKHFTVEIDYKKQRITFYEPNHFKKIKDSKTKNYATFPLTLKKRKSYISLHGEVKKGVNKKLDLLIDTGSWNALWLFASKGSQIYLPKKNVKDFLGFGLSGPIYGHRARIENLKIGKTVFNQPTTSFPDSSALGGINKSGRNGSLGGEVLRRFTVIMDYAGRRMHLKPNRDVRDPFYYNMAGLELTRPYPEVPVYEVLYVRPNSPAAKAGILKGDIVQSINGFRPDEISLNYIFELFRNKEGKRISIGITRDSLQIKYFEFILEKLI